MVCLVSLLPIYFHPDGADGEEVKGFATGSIVGIVIGCVLIVVILGIIMHCLKKKKVRQSNNFIIYTVKITQNVLITFMANSSSFCYKVYNY